MNENQKPHIAIVGAGAIGSLLGGVLAKNDENVTLIGKQAHVETIRQKGLAVDGAAGDFTVPIKASELLDFKPDIVFIAVKTQDVEQTCREIKSNIGNIPIVMMQNGVISTQIAGSIFGKENIIGCTIMLNARFQQPGVVSYINESPIVIGKVFSKNDAQVMEIQSYLNQLAPTEVSENIVGVQWSKLFVNALSNALDGMTGLSMGEYIQYANLRKIGILILKEAMTLVEKANIKLEPLPEIPLSIFRFLVSLPLYISAWLLKYVMLAKGNDNIITSTLQSLKKGKPTEIDYLNGEFVRLGEQIGFPTPYNSMVVKLIHNIERSGSFYSPEELSELFLSSKNKNEL